MASPQPPHDTNTSDDEPSWHVGFLFDVDLSLLQKGLFWSTRNIMLLRGHSMFGKQQANQNNSNPPRKRYWTLREFPDKPPSESRWEGSAFLTAQSAQTLDGFRLGKLKGQLICSAEVLDQAGNLVFAYDPKRPWPHGNKLFGDKKPADLWWLWPMESIIPDDGEEKESLSSPVIGLGDGKDEAESERSIAKSSGPASRREVGVPVLLGSVRVVA
ncbi:hypothetical protein OQA88_907 [Cercophora sp. LCS_1]